MSDQPARFEKPVVSVIIATHNRARYLAEAIDSLLAQSRPVDEIIVVDDASTDHTADVLEKYDGRLETVVFQTNQGKAAALNQTIPNARGDYIWLFDDDDIALSDALEQHLNLLDSRSDIDFTYSSAYHTSDAENLWNRTAWKANELPDVEPEAFWVQTLRSMNTLMQGMLIPRSALLDIGLFDTELYRCQDLDMLLRLAALYRGAKLDGPTFVYREHSGPRGGGAHTHSVEHRFREQDKYRKQVFIKIYDRFELLNYVGHLEASDIIGSREARTAAAHIQRGCIMLRQGLVDAGLADIEAGLSDSRVEHIDSNWIATNLSDALDVEPWMFDKPRRVAFGLARILGRHRQLDLVRSSARGLYWSLRREWQLRRASQTVTASALLGLFLTACISYRIKNALHERSNLS